MSLKFGIYLVEQRIISPEQFCGLVKIQQESTRTLSSIAITHNFLTMKQVSKILDIEQKGEKHFLDIAISEKLLDRTDANRLARMQERSGQTIQALAVDCGLLTERQSSVLYNHFMRNGSRTVKLKKATASAMSKTDSAAPVVSKASTNVVPQPHKARTTSDQLQPVAAPVPKFAKQRPMIMSEDGNPQ